MIDILQASQWTDILDGIDLVRVLTQGGALLACIVGLYALRGVWWGTRKSAVFAGRLVGRMTARSYRFLIPLPPEPTPINNELQNIFDHLADPQAVWEEKESLLGAGDLYARIEGRGVKSVRTSQSEKNILPDFTESDRGAICYAVLETLDRVRERDRLHRQAQIPRAKKTSKV